MYHNQSGILKVVLENLHYCIVKGSMNGPMAIFWLFLLCIGTCSVSAFSPRVERVVGKFGVQIGAAVEWSDWNYSTKSIPDVFGFGPKAYVLFTQIPFSEDDLWVMSQLFPSMGAQKQTVILTPEPFAGLEAVSEDVIQDTITFIKKWEDRGLTLIVRFAHEMNGSWYPWCQKPALFVEKFRLFSEALHAGTKYAAMLWAPNLGPGYPYKNGKYEAKCNKGETSVDCSLLDTNGDGTLTAADDMFSPYWPGNEHVDWIGSSLYWWGRVYPWGENEMPSAHFFHDTLMGRIKQETGEPIPDFYPTYSEKKDIAMIITETGALYNLCDTEPDTDACKVNIPNGLINPAFEFDIKSTWWGQVFSLEGSYSTFEAFPNIRMISWFNVRKEEQEVGGNTVDWTTYTDQDLKDAFIAQISLRTEDKKQYWITDEAKKAQSFGSRVDRVVERDGVLVGASVEWSDWNFSSKAIPDRVGYTPKSYPLYTSLPLTDFDKTIMQRILSNLSGSPLIIITVQPLKGMDKVTPATVQDFVSTIRKYEKSGWAFIVRFAPDMNGAWLPWSQTPTQYIKKFRLLSDALRSGTKYATMMWAPVVGQGYPFPDGQYAAQCGKESTSRDCKLLDTNGDGELTYLDDMYAPYWPGDAYVDWIGAALSWWGKAYPWGENEIPSPDYFYDSLIVGGTDGASSLYKTYSEGKDIAMIITETAALYNLCDVDAKTESCDTNKQKGWINPKREFDIKSTWWEQVFSVDGFKSTRKAFPNIKIISWLEISKPNAEVNENTVDWTTYNTKNIKESFLKTINQKSKDGVRYWVTG